MAKPSVRRDLRPGDLGAILEHHGRQYSREYGVDSSFEAHVAAGLANAALRGFPRAGEAIWVVELDGRHAGSLALTDEGDGEAWARWFLLDPAVRGHGLGRRLVDELVATARDGGYERIVLETFSDLRTAAHLYRSQRLSGRRRRDRPALGPRRAHLPALRARPSPRAERQRTLAGRRVVGPPVPPPPRSA